MSPLRRLSTSLVFPLSTLAVIFGCGSETAPTGNENVQVQVDTYFFYQDWTSSIPPFAYLTGPGKSATFSFTNTPSSLDGLKDDWHKYKMQLKEDDVVTLRVTVGGTELFEQSCTVHPRALSLTYAEFSAYGPSSAFDDDGNPLPNEWGAQCGCGFKESPRNEIPGSCVN